ncbi:MAG: tetratricopeptide repeat protein [Sedimentisphaerales bacterium]|nr:tetratricopeptide repeat protein [Sedimentisphaerales bacterium]
MRPDDQVAKAIQDKLQFAAGARLRERMLAEVLQAHDESSNTNPALTAPVTRRVAMRSPMTKLAAAAVLVAAVILTISLWDRSIPTAYAIEQTVEALQNARFLHLVRRDEAGQINDERWIEIGADGWQVRYRQENPAPRNFSVIEDGESTAVYRHERQAVILYDRDDQQYQWVGELGKALENLRQEGSILEENATYKGRPAHKVWWPFLSAECYVDPATKLPIAIGTTEMSYEIPPAGTFDIVIPEGYVVLDKRPGAPEQSVPDWLLAEEQAEKQADDAFEQATHALAEGNHAQATELFELVTQKQAARNWAWFWLGSAYYAQGQYELAIEKFTKVLDMFGNDACYYCNYARGLAYARMGADEAAAEDLKLCLPVMVQTLRTPSAASMFEYADDPLVRYGQRRPTEQQVVAKMVNRLRLVTGQNFGYDPTATAEQNEAAIAAWEQWLAVGGQIAFRPEAELVTVPGASESDR